MPVVDRPRGGIMDATGTDAPRDHARGWTVVLGTADTDASVQAVTAAGGSVRIPPGDSSYGRLALVADPAGATFSLVSVGETAATDG